MTTILGKSELKILSVRQFVESIVNQFSFTIQLNEEHITKIDKLKRYGQYKDGEEVKAELASMLGNFVDKYRNNDYVTKVDFYASQSPGLSNYIEIKFNTPFGSKEWLKHIKIRVSDHPKYNDRKIDEYIYLEGKSVEEIEKELDKIIQKRIRRKEKEYNLPRISNESESRHNMKLKINEKETPNIEIKNKGILEVPEGKNVDDLPLSHFVNLANKKGLSKITKALNNLQVWNKNDDPKLSKWAGDMIDKLNKKLKKDESITHRAYNLYNDESRRKEIADRLGGKFTPDDHLLICKDNKLINIQVGNKYKCTAFNGQRVEVVSVDDIYTDDRGDTATLTVSYRHKLYGVASTQLYESVDSIDKLNKKLKKDESLNKSLVKESSKKSYWKYSLSDRAIERMENSDRYFDERSIRQVKLYSCETEDECYEGDFWPVSNYEFPHNPIFGTKDEAYEELMYSLSNSMYERENDL